MTDDTLIRQAILPALSRGIVELSTRRREEALVVPYPALIQRALDRVVLDRLRAGLAPPTGVPELLSWCAAPVRTHFSAESRGLLEGGTTLIHPVQRLPTRSCIELASYGPDGLVEQDAEARLAELARSVTDPERFQQCKNFLIDYVFVMNDAPRRGDWNPLIWRLVEPFYSVMSIPDPENGITTCPECGMLAQINSGQIVWCDSELCSHEPVLRSGHVGSTRVLDRSLRLYLTLPGRTEKALLRLLAQRGVTAAPISDQNGAYRLSVSLFGRSTVQVFDRLEPTLLAAHVASRADLLAVVPDSLARARPHFIRSVQQALPADADVMVIGESELSKGHIGDA